MLLWVPAVCTTRVATPNIFSSGAASHVDVLHADERHDRVDVEKPAADDLQQLFGQPVMEACVDPLGRGQRPPLPRSRTPRSSGNP